MSNYQNRIDFISRTRQILVQYEHNCNSEKTLFMNCCVAVSYTHLFAALFTLYSDVISKSFESPI